jgi:hypothetical protein
MDLTFRYICSSASYQYLRTVERKVGPRPIFRLVGSDGVLNYHEILLSRRPQGIRAVDLFVYASGEQLSVTLLRAILTLLPPDKQTQLAGLSESAAAALREVSRLEYMNKAFNREEYENVLAMYASLPNELRASKPLQAMRLSAARKVNEAEHAAALDEYQKTFSNDPSPYLKWLHPLQRAPRHAELQHALTRLDELVGGDPYLQVVRTSTLGQPSEPIGDALLVR